MTSDLPEDADDEPRRKVGALGECVTQSPPLARGGDQGSVAVFLVVHRPWLDPRRHDDRGYSIRGAVEGEAQLASRGGWACDLSGTGISHTSLPTHG